MKKLFIVTVLILFLKGVINGQSCPTNTIISGSLNGTSQLFTGATLSFPNVGKTFVQTSFLRERNKAAKVHLKLDLGNDYVKNSTNWNFNIVAVVNYSFGTSPMVTRTLTITNSSPELLRVDDVLSTINSTLSISPLSVYISTVSITDGSNNPLTGLLANYVNNNVRLNVKLVRDYEVDVRLQSGLMSNAPLILPVTTVGRLVTFTWQPNGVDAYSNYEIQVMKLENKDVALGNNLNQISSTIDWSNALKVETQSYKATIKLTMAEGTGYYMWRVRPIGNYYAGGIGNSENYGEWSFALSNGATSSFNKSVLTGVVNPTPYAFYFTDPDEKVNWIYSRIFTEGDNVNQNNATGAKTSEGINYANGLLMSRQSQKYNSSENTNIVSQTEIDYSGRPALSTLPVPVSGNLNGYKVGFVKNNLGQLYTAASFDTDTKIDNPDKISDVSNPFSYYSNNSSSPINNSNVADAEGYSFKRTKFKGDGTNRVEEESGVGKAHSLGLQTNGQGHTTRILFGTPSDDELIRIFGEEAPLAESVIKTMTIDQNNVVSVTYTSKEGKTIATAMVSDNIPGLHNLKKASTVITVTNSVNENIGVDGRIVASKRIAVPSNGTLIKLSYTNDNLPGGGSGCPSGNCNFKMRFYLVDIKQNITYVSDADGISGITDFTPTGSFVFPAGWRFLNLDPVSPSTLTPTGTGNNEITLNSGEYVFIKEIFSGNAPNYAEQLVNVQNDKTRPVIDAIAAQMQLVSSPATYSVFLSFYNTLKAKMDNYNSGTPTVTTSELLQHLDLVPAEMPGYVFPYAADFTLAPIATNTADPTTDNMQITTGCCGAINIPIPKPAICYLCDGSPATAFQTPVSISTMTTANATASSIAITPYGINDFKNNAGWSTMSASAKRDAINILVERELINPLKSKMDDEGIPHGDLWKHVPGFSFSSLNFMFSNMLISQYYTGSSIEHPAGSGVWYAATKDNATGNYSLSVPVSSLTNIPYNYDCKRIYESWADAVNMLNSFEVGPSDNVLTSFNDQEGANNGQDNSDDDDNWLMSSNLAKKWLKRKISKELEEFSDSDDGKASGAKKQAITSVINTFFNYVGYQFASIVDGASLPSHISTGSGVFPDDYTLYPVSPLGPPSIYTSITTGVQTNTSVPLLFEVNGTSVTTYTAKCNGAINELYYPYIVKPEWQFKYYVYNVFENGIASPVNFINDADPLLPNQVLLDINRLYNKPYSYLPVSITSTMTADELCFQVPITTYSLGAGTFTTSYLHKNWNLSERSQFYGDIRGAAKCYTTKGIPISDALYDPPGQLPECATKAVLIADAVSQLDDHISACFDRKGEIRSALVNELTSSCYTIVPCKPANPPAGYITDKEIDLMVMAVISQATAEIQYVKNKFTSIPPATNTVACANPSLTTSSYSNLLCDLPSCSQVDCKEIFLYNNNTLSVTASRKIDVKYFADCDQKIINMVQNGRFFPNIPPLPGCPAKPPKVWQSASCLPETQCGPQYSEKKTCPPSDYQKYSKTFTVTATGN